MSAPFTETPIIGYNSNPPPNDGTSALLNTVDWDNHIDKIGDPIKNYVSANLSAISTAFTKVIGGSGVTSINSDYNVLSSDQGKAVVYSGAGGHTITTPDATIVGSPFVFAIVNTSSSDVTVDGFSAQTINGSANATIAAGNGGFLFTDGTNWVVVSYFPPVEVAVGVVSDAPPGFSYSGTTDLVFAAKDCTADNAAKSVMTANSITKSISTTFTAGTGNGCLDTGTIATDTWYAVFAIAESTTSLVQDFLISLSPTAPTMPGGYALKRRIGWFLTDGSSQITPFAQDPYETDRFYLETPVNDFVSTVGTTASLIPLTAPPFTRPMSFARNSPPGATPISLTFTSPDLQNDISSLSAFRTFNSAHNTISLDNFVLDASSQIRARATGTTGVEIDTYGHVDRRGRDG